MSPDDVNEFLERLDQDEELAVSADDAFVEALHGVASAAGYSFSQDELRAGMDGAAGLSDDQLDEVTGGSGTLTGASMPSLADTVFAGTTSANLLVQPSTLRFASFSKLGFRR